MRASLIRWYKNFRFLVKDEYQPLSVIPYALWFTVALALAAQITATATIYPAPEAKVTDLTARRRTERLKSLLSGISRRWRAF